MIEKVDAYDSEVDDVPLADAIFIAKLSHVGSVNKDEVGLTYDSYILSEGRARQWMKQLSTGLITTWDLFKNDFLSKYRPPSQISSKLMLLETLSKNPMNHCILHGNGLDTETRRKVDFKGPIPRMTPAAGIKSITELSRHSQSWYKEGDLKNNNLNIVFGQINNFEQNMNNITEEVRMVQHKYKLPDEEKNFKPEETLRTFIEESLRKHKQNESLFWKIKKNCDKVFKKQASSIKIIEGHLGRIAETIHGRGVGSLPSFTKTNLRGLAHAITTRSRLNYNLPKNPLEEIHDIQNKTTENISTKEGSPDNKKIIIEISPSPIPFPRRLRKEKDKEQFQKFFENL
ncbi:hypothetical protein Tco_1043627 [Tanacetum coccineum]|uniref:Retrotransposon gag domain-containing protein n=1 Tax=Tanacetum coccineum TaxID=301880 RepID=A0ABQ5GPL6_9ASTR